MVEQIVLPMGSWHFVPLRPKRGTAYIIRGAMSSGEALPPIIMTGELYVR